MLIQAHELLHCTALQEALSLLSESSVSPCRPPQSAATAVGPYAGEVATASPLNLRQATLATEQVVNSLAERGRDQGKA